MLTRSELDRSRSSTKKSALGGSLFSSAAGSSAPPELQPLFLLQDAVTKAVATAATTVPTAKSDYEKLKDPAKPVPTPPVHAARLSALLKSLVSAKSAVDEKIRARRSLLADLKKLVESNEASLIADETDTATFADNISEVEEKKKDVEDSIMRNLSADNTPVTPGEAQGRSASIGAGGANLSPHDAEPERPDVEALTPPPIESTTPTGEPTTLNGSSTSEPPASLPPMPAGSDLLSSLNIPAVRPYAGMSYGVQEGNTAKRRRLEDGNDVFGSGEVGEDIKLDADVEELLRSESAAR